MGDNRYNSSILVVDDNDAVRDLLTARLEDRGYHGRARSRAYGPAAPI
jgi:CheY-like chemotaxis protein